MTSELRQMHLKSLTYYHISKIVRRQAFLSQVLTDLVAELGKLLNTKRMFLSSVIYQGLKNTLS